MVAIRREAIDAHRRFCCPVPLTTPAPVHACRSCGRRQITDQEGRRRIPSARFCEFPAPHSPSPSILPLSRRQLYTDLTGLTATQLWQHPAWRAARRLDLSIAGQPGKPVASVTRRPAPNPGRGRGFAPSRTSVRPDHRRLAARCDHRATQSRIVLAFVPALRGRLRTKFRTGIVRGVAARASRSCRSGCGCGRPPTRLHACGAHREAGEFSSGAGVFFASRQFMTGLLAEPALCEIDISMPSGPACPSRRSASSRGCRLHGTLPHRRGDAGDLAPVDIRTNPQGCSRRPFPPKYNR
jgi:hypothetical protein